MKSKVLRIFAGLLIVILFGALLLPGCSGGASSFTCITGLTKMVPQDAGAIFFIDVKRLMSDSDFSELYNDMKDSFQYAIDAGLETDIMDFEDIHYIGMVEAGYGEVVLLNGDFNLDAIRDILKDEDYYKDDYMGVEIWYGNGDVVAIHNGTLIIGNESGVEASIEAIDDPETSAYEKDEDIRDIVREMPSGLYSMVVIGGFYPGAGAAGMSFSKVNADLMKFSGCFKFESNEDAEEALSDVESDMGSEDFSSVKVSRSGNLVKFSAELDMEDASVFW